MYENEYGSMGERAMKYFVQKMHCKTGNYKNPDWQNPCEAKNSTTGV
jgi:hypothetical protein